MIVARSKSSLWLHVIFAVMLIANFGFWVKARTVLPKWDNVPAAPGPAAAAFAGFGDLEIAYRMFGYFLQNTGNAGGHYESLKLYNYDLLGEWFRVSQTLDPRANYVPFLAAYYFGALEEPSEKLDPVIEYLTEEGAQPYPEKWRWMAQAVYLARYRQHDLPKALKIANRLASIENSAPWAKQMPAFIQLQMGNKEASYEIMMQMLASESGKLHPNEVNYMRDFICTRALDKAQAAKNPLCQNAK